MLEDKHLVLPSAQLAAMVEEAYDHTLACVGDLDDEHLTVPLMEIVNPFLWELGHCAFFYDIFLLRVVENRRPIMATGDDLYDSFKVDHDDRWRLDLPDRRGTLGYMERVKDTVLERLASGRPDARETYLHLLAVVHSDMHCEAFTYMRQTLDTRSPSFRRTAPGPRDRERARCPATSLSREPCSDWAPARMRPLSSTTRNGPIPSR